MVINKFAAGDHTIYFSGLQSTKYMHQYLNDVIEATFCNNMALSSIEQLALNTIFQMVHILSQSNK